VELDGEYYYTDTTWMDGDGTGISNNWFNFNEKLVSEFTQLEMTNKGMHGRDYLAILLPAANGTKYSHDYNPDEDYTLGRRGRRLAALHE
jgi:hypothetical protein